MKQIESGFIPQGLQANHKLPCVNEIKES